MIPHLLFLFTQKFFIMNMPYEAVKGKFLILCQSDLMVKVFKLQYDYRFLIKIFTEQNKKRSSINY